ncbi:MAG: 4a-hydroxytetrahydrobiopterin dehydratase [Bryobacterales bacterium]|nr:4a-hydroxytetrahydrobiopterin dehydratase [Bryobacterales bacterium]
MSLLTNAQLETALAALPGWTILDGQLHRTYTFPDFTHAFGFMATAATAIERMNHHPEWCNVYNRVSVNLSTHDAGGITQKDLDLALLLESIAKRLQ